MLNARLYFGVHVPKSRGIALLSGLSLRHNISSAMSVFLPSFARRGLRENGAIYHRKQIAARRTAFFRSKAQLALNFNVNTELRRPSLPYKPCT